MFLTYYRKISIRFFLVNPATFHKKIKILHLQASFCFLFFSDFLFLFFSVFVFLIFVHWVSLVLGLGLVVSRTAIHVMVELAAATQMVM